MKTPKRTTLLIDGDILAFRAVSANFHETEWEPDLWTYFVDYASAKDAMHSQVKRLTNFVEPDDIVVAITGAGNFRQDLYPAYKGHRKPKPPGYRWFQEWIEGEFDTFKRPLLEADDILGILATDPDMIPGVKIIWSGDKDLKQIPGLHLDETTGKLFTVTEAEGERLHAYQTLIGDTTDNYPGCPGVGPVTAAEALKSLTGPRPFTHTFQRGPRKGETETRFAMEPMGNQWAVVRAFYDAAGMSRDDMVLQARLARILRADDYDFDNKQPLLWEPPTT